MMRPVHSRRPLTIAEAAQYLGYRTTAAFRGLAKKQQLRPCGRGARDQHLFELSDQDRYTRDRGREASGAPGGDEHHAPLAPPSFTPWSSSRLDGYL